MKFILVIAVLVSTFYAQTIGLNLIPEPVTNAACLDFRCGDAGGVPPLNTSVTAVLCTKACALAGLGHGLCSFSNNGSRLGFECRCDQSSSTLVTTVLDPVLAVFCGNVCAPGCVACGFRNGCFSSERIGQCACSCL